MVRDKVCKPVKSLSLLDTVDEPIALVCYTNSDNRHWFQLGMKDGFEHCFIVYWNGYMWLRLEKLFGYHYAEPILHLDGYILNNENIKSYFESKGYVCQTVDLSKRSDKLRCKHVFTLYNCVEYIKDFLGVSAWYVKTPYQLYKWIDKHYGCNET